jgi:hypothetical protein
LPVSYDLSANFRFADLHDFSRSFLTVAGNELNLISGAANGRVTLWNPTAETLIKEMYKLDDSMGKVNSLKAYHWNDDQIHIAVAGTSKSSNSGALNIYHLQ